MKEKERHFCDSYIVYNLNLQSENDILQKEILCGIIELGLRDFNSIHLYYTLFSYVLSSI